MDSDEINWGVKPPAACWEYRVDISAPVNAALDTVATAAISVSPWGPGELKIESFEVVANMAPALQWTLVAWVSGGVAGRLYRLRAEVPCAASPRAFEWVFRLAIDPELAVFPPPPLINPGWSVPVVWGSGPLFATLGTLGRSRALQAAIVSRSHLRPSAQDGPTIGSVTAPPVMPGRSSYTFVQSVPLATWVIAHGLDRFPGVEVTDASGHVVECDVAYTSRNVVTVSFAVAFAGTAYLN